MHRLHQMRGQLVPHKARLLGVGGSGGIGIDRTIRHTDRRGGKGCRQLRPCRGHAFRMEAASDRQRLHVQPSGAQTITCGGDGGRRASDDGLVRRIHIGQNHARPFAKCCPHGLGPGVDGRHGAQIGIALRHGLHNRVAARMGQVQQRFRVKRPGRMQGGIFAKAVADAKSGIQSQIAQNPQNPQRHRANRRLGDIGTRQRVNLRLRNGRVQGGNRVDQMAKGIRSFAGQPMACLFKGLTHLREMHRQPCGHTGVLRSLTGEKESDLILRQRRTTGQETAARINAARDAVRRRWGSRQLLGGLRQTRGKPSKITSRGHKRQTCRGGGIKNGHQAGGNIRQTDCGRRLGQTGGGAVQHRRQGRGIGGRKHQHLIRPIATERGLMRRQIATVIFFQNDMEIRAAKAKGADPGAARRLAQPQPRPGLGLHIERAFGEVRGRAGFGHIQCCRLHLMMQRQRHLDQTGATGCRLCVADHRLDRSDTAELHLFGAGQGKDLGQAFNLGPVPDDGAGAMRFHHADGAGGNPGPRIGAAQSLLLALGARGGQGQIAPVRRSGCRAQHGVNPATLGLHIFQTAQNHQRQTFGNRDPVGAGVKGAATTTRRQRPCFRKGHEIKRVLKAVNPADNHHIRGACL